MAVNLSRPPAAAPDVMLDLHLITPGIELYTSVEVMRDEHGMPFGGVVVAYFDEKDHATGETVRRFRCFDPSRPGTSPMATPLLAEYDVDPDTIRPASRQRLSNCIRRLCQWLQRGRSAERRNPRMGVLSPEEAEWARWIGVLANELGAMR